MFESVDRATVRPAPGPSLVHASVAIDDVVAIQQQIDALEGRKVEAVERARRAAARAEAALLSDDDLALGRAGAERRRELARRAFTADLATALRRTEAATAHLVDTARTLMDDGQATLDALRAGRLSLAHATAVADTPAGLPTRESRALVESTVLPHATEWTVPQLKRHLRRARDLAHPEPFAERHRRAAGSRTVYLDPGADGMAWLTALLPAPTAHAAYDRLTRAGACARETGDRRTLAQLRADGLASLLLAGVDGVPGERDPHGLRSARDDTATGETEETGAAGAPDSRDVPDLARIAQRITPTVRVTVPVLSLLCPEKGLADDSSMDDSPADDSPADDSPANDSRADAVARAGRTALLDGDVPIDAATASALATAAPSLRRLLVDPVDGRVLTTDPGTYTVPTALRAFLQERDRTCRFPGCTRPAARCDVDHVVAWAEGGRTVADNLVHLCRHHHVLKHQTSWRSTPGTDGALTWISPTGRVRHDPPAQGIFDIGRHPGRNAGPEGGISDGTRPGSEVTGLEVTGDKFGDSPIPDDETTPAGSSVPERRGGGVRTDDATSRDGSHGDDASTTDAPE